jgi:transcription antitermination factor NusG
MASQMKAPVSSPTPLHVKPDSDPPLESKYWVILELSPQGEQATPKQIDKSLRKRLQGKCDVFIPGITYKRRGKDVTIHYMQGYVFVEAGLPSSMYFDLVHHPFIASVLYHFDDLTSANPRMILSLLPDSEIEKMREELENLTRVKFEVGDEVLITEGIYKNMKATIKSVHEDSVNVEIKMRSMMTLIDMPVAMMRYLTEEDEAMFLDV